LSHTLIIQRIEQNNFRSRGGFLCSYCDPVWPPEMATLSFSLQSSALVPLHDALSCLSKFSESVSIEAEYDLVSTNDTMTVAFLLKEGLQKLRLSALNTTKTGYASFVFDADKFFSRFSFSLRRNKNTAAGIQAGDRFACQIYLKVFILIALLFEINVVPMI
jgi:cell cycle checkpoint control protein RAD9A